jgi:hypothetical protein
LSSLVNPCLTRAIDISFKSPFFSVLSLFSGFHSP